MAYLVFLWRPSGYELVEREGDPPSVGDVVEEEGGQVTVVKVVGSPLPGDSRRCAYVQPV
jgi:hypothetical protein